MSVLSYFRTKWLKLRTEPNSLMMTREQSRGRKTVGTEEGSIGNNSAPPPQVLVYITQLQQALTFLPWQKHSSRDKTILKQLCFGKFFFQLCTIHFIILESTAPNAIGRKLPNLSFLPLIQTVLIYTKVSAAYLSEQEHNFPFPNNFLNILLSFPLRKFIHSM